jgi:hypothetical protein
MTRPKRRILNDGGVHSINATQGHVEATTKAPRDQAAINRKIAANRNQELQNLKYEVQFLQKAKNNIANENERLREDVENLKKRLLDSEKKRLDKRNDYEWAVTLKSKGFPEVQKETNGDQLVNMISKAILAVMAIVMAFTKPIKRLRTITKVLFDCCIFGADETRSVLMTLTRKFIRSEVFVPWKILKAMDMAPKGSLNYTGIEVLRGVEGLDKWEQGALPARSTIQKQARKMYDVGQQIIPIMPVQCPLGEMFMFDYERKLRLILKTFGLEEVASRSSIEICITLDGAELCDYLSHLTAGVKVVDKRAIDPRSKKPLCTSIGKYVTASHSN